MVGVIVAAHGALAYGLMQVREMRDAIAGAMPVFVSMVTPAPKAAPPQVTPPAPRMAPRAVKRVITAEPTTPPPSPAPFTAAPPPESVSTAAAAQAGRAPTAPPVTALPTLIPASAVRYLEVPVLVYPRASRRAGEAGHVVLRVFIDEAGLPRQVLVNQSSGFARLDEAATTAVQKARFKPYSDNGQALAAWALVPLSFDLEK